MLYILCIAVYYLACGVDFHDFTNGVTLVNSLCGKQHNTAELTACINVEYDIVSLLSLRNISVIVGAAGNIGLWLNLKCETLSVPSSVLLKNQYKLCRLIRIKSNSLKCLKGRGLSSVWSYGAEIPSR